MIDPKTRMRSVGKFDEGIHQGKRQRLLHRGWRVSGKDLTTFYKTDGEIKEN
jgi:hypothetical protein